MARIATEHNERMAQRIRPEDKRLIMRAAALRNTDLSKFVVDHALSAAKQVIEEAERIQLSERDTYRVLDLLENPPPPTPRLLQAVRDLPPLPES